MPCLGLHILCLLCCVECTKVVWQTKAVQFIDSLIGGEHDVVRCRQMYGLKTEIMSFYPILTNTIEHNQTHNQTPSATKALNGAMSKSSNAFWACLVP